jgi:hypothetical protein
LLAFTAGKKAGEDARRILPLNKNVFWNWETLASVEGYFSFLGNKS